MTFMTDKAACNIAAISPREAILKKRLRRHLAELGFYKTRDGKLEIAKTGKEIIRALHSNQRDDLLTLNQSFLWNRLPKLLKHFASGTEVDPRRISPVLQRIRSHTWESDLFRVASLTWAVPVSHGFGRR